HDDADKVRDKILEIAGYLDNEIDPEDVVQARRRLTYESLYDVEDRFSRSQALVAFFAAQGQPIGWPKVFDRAESLDGDQVRAIGSRVLARDRAFVMLHTPVPPGSNAESSKDSSVSAKHQQDAGNMTKLHSNLETLPERYPFTQPSDAYLAW